MLRRLQAFWNALSFYLEITSCFGLGVKALCIFLCFKPTKQKNRDPRVENQRERVCVKERDLLLTGGCVFRQLWIFRSLKIIKWKVLFLCSGFWWVLSDKDKGRREKRESDGDRVRREREDLKEEKKKKKVFFFLRFMPLTTEAVL